MDKMKRMTYLMPLTVKGGAKGSPGVIIGRAHWWRHACAKSRASPSLAAEVAGGGTNGGRHLTEGRGQLGAAMFVRGNLSLWP